jgi:hypothetical protein
MGRNRGVSNSIDTSFLSNTYQFSSGFRDEALEFRAVEIDPSTTILLLSHGTEVKMTTTKWIRALPSETFVAEMILRIED